MRCRMKLSVVGLVTVVGCTAFDKVMTDMQIGCAAEELAESVIPTGTPIATVATDVATACDLADKLIPDLENAIAAYENGQVANGAAPAVTAQYRPAPWAVAKIAAKRAAKK